MCAVGGCWYRLAPLWASLSLQEAEGGEGGGEEERDKEEEGGGRTEECAALSRGRAGKGGRTLAIMRHVPACKLQGGVV